MSNTNAAPITRLVGKGRAAINLVVDEASFVENQIGLSAVPVGVGPGAVVGTAQLYGQPVTVISNDSMVANPRFPVVYAGIIGLEEAYKMALAVYLTMEQDEHSDVKRPIIQLVDSPGNGPGLWEEIIGMNKATGSYQLALAEARKAGHPIVAMIIGRAISGAFLCHGLQAGRILALPAQYGTVIHVMPLTSIARITKMDIEELKELSQGNPVFASGAEFFYRLGGADEIVEDTDSMKDAIAKSIRELYALYQAGEGEKMGPAWRGELGFARDGRIARKEALALMEKEFAAVEARYID